MTKIKSIPSIEKGMLASRDQERANSMAMNGLRKVKLSKIVVREGFNLRESFEEIDILAESIETVGLQYPLKVDLLSDGTSSLVDGERRYRALLLLAGRSPELKKKYEDVPAIVNTKQMSESDRLVIMLTTQSAHTFSQLEVAEGYRRLRDGHLGEEPMTTTQIAARVGQSVPYVEAKLILADASPEEKNMIRENKVSATALVTLTRQEGDSVKRVAAVKEKNSQGKKLMVKDVKNKPVAEMCADVLLIFNKIDQKFNPTGELGNMLLDARAKVYAIKKTIQ